MTDGQVLKKIIAGIVLTLLISLPLVIAALSPLQASREAVYVVGGLAGVAALCIMVLQPLLAAGFFPKTTLHSQRRWHTMTGSALIALVTAHIVGLYLTSPPDMIDALLLVAPTTYSYFGVAALASLLLLGLITLPAIRNRLPPRLWRPAHNVLGVLVATTTVVHAVMIEGTMTRSSKWVLCAVLLGVTAAATYRLRRHLPRSTTSHKA